MNPRATIRLIGILLLMLGATMLASGVVALLYEEGDAWGIFLSAVIVMATGGGSALLFRRHIDLGLRDGFAVVSFGWLAMSVAGALPFLLTGAIPDVTDAFFESASGFTTTGASILTNIEALPHGVLFWRSFTHWVGGMGIIVFSIAILPFLGVGGMQMFKAESPGPTADKLTPRIRDTAEILWVVYVLFTALEIVLLRLAGMEWFDSACHAFGTMATGGFSTKNASIAHYSSSYIHWIITLFMFIAGVSFNLHYMALRGRFKRYWKSREFRFFAFVIFGAILVITGSRLLTGDPFFQALRDSSFTVLAIGTTTGYATADFELWHLPIQFLLIGLMFMGGMAGSTGGGLKAIRVLILLKQARIELHKLVHPNTVYPMRIGEKVLPDEVVRNVLGMFLLYGILMGIGVIIMSLLGQDFVTSSTSVVACLSNIGPGLGEVGPTNNYAGIHAAGKWFLSLLMIVGRLEIYTVLVLFTATYWSK